MCYKFILFLWGLFHCFQSLLALKGCEKLLHELANEQMVFLQCATVNAVPVKLCTSCEPHFESMTKAYSALTAVKNCTDMYFDQDRINIVPTSEAILLGIWNKAYCDDCFKGNNTNTFNNLTLALQNCFENNKGEECNLCIREYQDLNDFYISMVQHKNGKICFETQDTMNRTRSRWSKDFKCCKREADRTLFFITSGFITLLPIMFYSSMYILTKLRERNHDILHIDHEVVVPSTSTSALIRESATDVRNKDPPPKKGTEEDSDDELLD